MRYFVFGYDTYYPCGGMNDLMGTYSTKEEAIDYANKVRMSGNRDHVSVWDMVIQIEIYSDGTE